MFKKLNADIKVHHLVHFLCFDIAHELLRGVMADMVLLVEAQDKDGAAQVRYGR